MIQIGDVLEGYKSTIDYGANVRMKLLVSIYQYINSVDVESSKISKDNLLRIKFIVSIHDQIFETISKEYEKFQEFSCDIDTNFNRIVKYSELYDNIDYFCELVFKVDEMNSFANQVSDYDAKLIPDWFFVFQESMDSELDMYEEDIATKLIKLLEKGKER